MPKHDRSSGWPIGVTLCVVLAIASLASSLWELGKSHPANSGSWEVAAQRGDYLGGHLAVAGSIGSAFLLLAAVLLQGHELKLQREELSQSRDVFRRQAEELEKQTKIAERSALIQQALSVVAIQADLYARGGGRMEFDRAEEIQDGLTPFFDSLLSNQLLTEDEQTMLRNAVKRAKQ